MNPQNNPKSIKTLRDYFQLANVTLADRGEHLNRAHSVLGLKTEAGEALDALKRHVFYGLPLNTVNLAEEIGDLAWYCHIPVLEILSKNLDSVSPFKHNILIESLDISLEDYVKFSVIDFVFDGEVDFDSLHDFDSEEPLPELQQLREMLEDQKLNLPEVFNDILLSCLDNNNNLALLDTCCYTMRKLAIVSFALNIPLQSILEGNIGKLLKRYPKEKFDALDTSLRDLLLEENKVAKAIANHVENSVNSYSKTFTVDFPYYSL
jgi:NTP pyrophosphatase (non-canonical NTP hydrolase)